TPATPSAPIAYAGRPIRLFLPDREDAVARVPPAAAGETSQEEASSAPEPLPAQVDESEERVSENTASPQPPSERAPLATAEKVETSRDEDTPPERSVSAGRVERKLSRKAVRFLWQTDAAGRVLFVSPGLAQ